MEQDKNKKRSIEPFDEESEKKQAVMNMMSVACVVENRTRETVVAVCRNWRSLEVFTLVDNPSYVETTGKSQS